MIVKHNASLDASFWINIVLAGLVDFINEYFYLFVNTIVAQEIRYPLVALGIASQTVVLFNDWVQTDKINL